MPIVQNFNDTDFSSVISDKDLNNIITDKVTNYQYASYDELLKDVQKLLHSQDRMLPDFYVDSYIQDVLTQIEAQKPIE